MSEALVIGIDVGGTKLAGVALAGAGILAERRVARARTPLPEQVIALGRELIGAAGREPAAVGLAVPGQVDTSSGVMAMAVHLGAEPLPIGAIVSEAFHVPTAVEHDARAVAAWLAGRPDAVADLAYVGVGTGISAGIVLGGSVLRGADGLVGEIGHMLVDPEGPTCVCGLVGCLETIASGPSVARAAANAVRSGEPTTLPEEPTTAEVYRASAAGDAVACRVVERAARHLAAAIRGLALGFGVSRVLVGGGVTQAGAAFVEPLKAALDRERESPLVNRALPRGSVDILDDDRPLGALGAGAVARASLPPSILSMEREVG